MICTDCGHSIRTNRICERPIQSATDMLKHMAAHNASHAFVITTPIVEPKPEAFLSSGELASASALSALPEQVASGPEPLN
jgi:hypothetical protein